MNHDKPLDRGITNPYTYVYIYIFKYIHIFIYIYVLKYAPLVDGNLRGVEQLN